MLLSHKKSSSETPAGVSELQYKIFFPLFMPKRAFKSVLLARQQHRQHGFLDVETVLRFVKDLVRVLLE